MMNDANYAYLEECGLSRLSQAESLPSVMHDDYNRWLAHLRADIAINVGFPSPTEPNPVTRSIALLEKHRKKPQSAAEILSNQNVFRAQDMHNRLCALVPRVRYWPADERELFGMEPDDNKLPHEGASLYELEQQFARISNAIDKAKEMPPHERTVFIFSRRLEKLEARVKHLEEQQGKAIA
jgi:hypothetical protein